MFKNVCEPRQRLNRQDKTTKRKTKDKITV